MNPNTDTVVRPYLNDWNAYIITDPEIANGKPIVKGTRLTVDFIIRLFADGWTQQQIIENYPTLTDDAIRAFFAYAAECIADVSLYSINN